MLKKRPQFPCRMTKDLQKQGVFSKKIQKEDWKSTKKKPKSLREKRKSLRCMKKEVLLPTWIAKLILIWTMRHHMMMTNMNIGELFYGMEPKLHVTREKKQKNLLPYNFRKELQRD